ncbi:MAG: alpha/beta hydrolase [Bacteroidota bacterium]
MKQLFLSLLLIHGIGIKGISQLPGSTPVVERGTVHEGLSMESSLLDSEVNYAIYLPPGYKNSQRNYPVVYLLHGFTDNETAWIQFGEVHLTADRAIAERKIPPMIIVMPDGGVTWYINDISGKISYEDMIMEEFIPFIDENYNTRPEKEFRAVAGLSMGGYGSLIWSLHNPHVFSACAAFSAGVMTDEEIQNMEEENYNRLFKDIYVNAKGKNRLSSHWKNNSVIELVRSLPVEEIEKIRFYIDCGDDDFLYKGNSSLHIEMRNRGIDHEYRVKNGSHSWEYWRTNIIEGLQFIGESFHR